MKPGLPFLRRNTGLTVTITQDDLAEGEALPLAKDLAWYPLLAVATALMLAGFFYPLAMIALPVELAALLTILWQGALTGFRVESAMLRTEAGSTASGQGAGIAVFLLLVLVKIAALRQMFPEEAAHAFLFCGATTYCLPLLASRVLCKAGSRSGLPGASRLSIVAGLGVWLAAVIVMAAPELFYGGLHASELRPVLVMAGGSLFAWMLCMDSRRRLLGSHLPPWNREMFAGCLAAECGGLVALLAARNASL